MWKEQNYWNNVEYRKSDFQGQRSDWYLHASYKNVVGRNLVIRLARRMGFLKRKSPRLDASIKRAYRAIQNPVAPHREYADAIFAQQTKNSRVFGESCPQYAFLRSETFAQMHALNANTRFIFVMRDPVARLVSGVKHNMRMQGEEGLMTEDKLWQHIRNALDAPDDISMLHCRYDDVIEKLEAAVPRENIKYGFFENLFEQAQIDELCDFLGIAREAAKFDIKVNSDTKPSVNLTSSQRAVVATALTGVYAALDAKFGNALPAAWRTSAALIGQGVTHA